jgi:hypothetical protein
MRTLQAKSVLAATAALVFLSRAAAGDPPTFGVSQRHGQSCRGDVGSLPVLVLRGTHRERGEAHGFLGAKEIVKTCDAVATAVNAAGKAGAEETGWSAAKKLMSRFQYPERFQVELGGMLQGLQAALPEAKDRKLKATGAEVTLDDLKMLQCAGDVLELMQCSQFSAWGSLTPDGSTIIGRNLDYPPVLPQDTYCAFAVAPAEKGLQKTLDATWFGMIGAGMACLNEEGVYLSGNDAGREDPTLVKSPVPAALALRMAEETARARDPLTAVQRNIDQKTPLALLYHIVAPAGPEGQSARAFVFEHFPGVTTPFEARVRHPSGTPPDALIVTNDPLIGAATGGREVCDRYASIEKALSAPEARGKVDFALARAIMDAVSRPDTLYSAVVSPGRKEMRLAVSPAPGKSATKQDYVILQWEAVFGLR